MRTRIVWLLVCAALVIAGAVAALLVSGTTGQVLAFILIAVGLVFATSLVFYEVGLSEDRELAREERARASRRRVNRQFRFPRQRDHTRRLR